MTSEVLPTSRSKFARLRASKLLRWSGDALLLIGVLALVNVWQTRDLPSGKLPAFALRTLSGETVAPAQLLGSPTLLVFWAPWCGVCRVESQNVSWLQALLAGRAKVMSIAVQYDRLSQVSAYVNAQGVDYPVLLGGRDAAASFDVHAYPTLFFLDDKGAIKRASVGYTTTLGMLWRLLL